ncbi:GAF domain-containing hybrid sensor histidine kinase/response regulator [Pelagicoccus albus]|uniref:histidine kinase n=1 Tax=Pelagicoccus albus TaxID=415222 RepID=A0A7X1B8I9_9BACT|nr:GAF domain-containing hybrid sensor histidine kinase/response regulator [Pelagicoccus albus]MBC2607329.1 response regulator [Pelagicoccus albus]
MRENTVTLPIPEAPPGFLKSKVSLIREVALELGQANDPDEVMRIAISRGREVLGFSRLSVWLFDGGFHALRGTFGVDEHGSVVDERQSRVFDHVSVGPQREAWSKAPHYFVETNSPLRDSAGGIIGHGIHFTAPLYQAGQPRGYLSADDLLECPSLNQETGELMCLFAEFIAASYFSKIAEKQAYDAIEAQEQSEAAKREFLGMLSHEVRTPLNAILGYSQLLSMQENSEEQRSLAKTIESSGDHLLQMLNSMIDYSNLADRDLRARYTSCDPVQLAESVSCDLAPEAKRKKLNLDFIHLGDFSGSVLADAQGLKKILFNLIENAIKFTTKGGVKITAQTQPTPNRTLALQFTIEDTGCGIPLAEQSTVFEPFRQIDSSLTRKHGGVGMGLAVVERLVSGIRGKIHLESKENHGSTFTLNFEFDYDSAAPQVARTTIGSRASPSKPHEKCNILVVEDNPDDYLLVEQFIKGLGYPCPTWAKGGESAKGFIARHPYDFVLMDLQMPTIDGLQLTRLVRSGDCGVINKDVPIIGMTSNDEAYARERAIATGMDEYLSKPFKIKNLESVIQRVLEGQSPLPI